MGEINMERDVLLLTHFAYQSDFDRFVCCSHREFMVEAQICRLLPFNCTILNISSAHLILKF